MYVVWEHGGGGGEEINVNHLSLLISGTKTGITRSYSRLHDDRVQVGAGRVVAGGLLGVHVAVQLLVDVVVPWGTRTQSPQAHIHTHTRLTITWC